MFNDNSSLYRRLLLSSTVIASLLLYVNNTEGKIEPKNLKDNTLIIQQQDSLASKVNSIYSRVLMGDKCMTLQGYIYEIDVPKYNLGGKDNKEYLAVYSKEKDNKHGFVDIGANGTPEVYIIALAYPDRNNATSITEEAIELYTAKGDNKQTNNGKYFLINDSNRTDMKEKYEKLVNEVIKDNI